MRAEVEELQHDGFEGSFLIETAGLDAVLGVEADIHGVFDLAIGPAGGLADILIHGEGRDAQGRTDLGGGTLFILHDLDMLEKAELAEEHREHIHAVGTGEELIPHEEEGAAALAGDHGIHHLEDGALG